MSQSIPPSSHGQVSWKDVRPREGFPQLSTRVKIIRNEQGSNHLKRKSGRSEAVTFNPADDTQYIRRETDVLCDGGQYRLPYYKPGPLVISQYLSLSANQDGSQCYQLIDGQGEEYQTLVQAASQLAFTDSNMVEAAKQGIDSGKWTEISTKTMQGKNGDSVTVVSSARVFAAGTELDEAIIIPGSPASSSMSGTIVAAQSHTLSPTTPGSRKRQKPRHTTPRSPKQRSMQGIPPQFLGTIGSAAYSNQAMETGPEVTLSQPPKRRPKQTEERLLYPTTSTKQPDQVASSTPPDKHDADYEAWLRGNPSMKPWPSVTVRKPVQPISDGSDDADGSNDNTQL